MKSTDPRDSNLEISSKQLSDRHFNKQRSLTIASIAIASIMIGSGIILTGTLTSQAQTAQVPAKPLAAGACPNSTNAAITPNRGMYAPMSMAHHGMMMTGDAADRHFLEMMVPHHDGAVKMADLAIKRSKNPAILQLAETIKRDQTLEITKMRDWYKQWYKVELPTEPSYPMRSPRMMGMNAGRMGMSMMTEDLKALETARDSDFDQMFLAQMIPHHRMALMMSNMIVDSDRPEMRQLARDILRSQSQEIEQMHVLSQR